MSGPRAPYDVNARAKAVWKSVVQTYDLEDWQLEILRRVCELITIVDQARSDLDRAGSLTYLDRFEQPKPRPEISIINQGIGQINTLLQKLYLDPADEKDIKV